MNGFLPPLVTAGFPGGWHGGYRDAIVVMR
jgi:hypothetical protein